MSTKQSWFVVIFGESMEDCKIIEFKTKSEAELYVNKNLHTLDYTYIENFDSKFMFPVDYANSTCDNEIVFIIKGTFVAPKISVEI